MPSKQKQNIAVCDMKKIWLSFLAVGNTQCTFNKPLPSIITSPTKENRTEWLADYIAIYFKRSKHSNNQN